MKIIACNWKMNGTRQQFREMLNNISNTDTKSQIIMIPGFTLMPENTGKIDIGAQDISEYKSGAFTGDISGDMLRDAGAGYVLVGHSERREYHNESNQTIKNKANRAIESAITPIICIGETAEEFDMGKTYEIIATSLMECIPETAGDKFIIAYEPRWAIGKNKTPTASQIEEIFEFITNGLNDMGFESVPIIYGGGVNASNAADILSIKNVSGLLIGSASLKIETLIPIIKEI